MQIENEDFEGEYFLGLSKNDNPPMYCAYKLEHEIATQKI
jgi:hypothetical protein